MRSCSAATICGASAGGGALRAGRRWPWAAGPCRPGGSPARPRRRSARAGRGAGSGPARRAARSRATASPSRGRPARPRAGRARPPGRAPNSARLPAACTRRRAPRRRRRAPSRGSGANTARRVPRTRSARPSCAASQLRSRCAGVSPLCRATMRRPAKRRVKRSISCGVRLISGTSTSACRPAASASVGGAQVDLGLAAAGDAVQERRPGRLAGHRRGDRADRLGLVAGQRGLRVGRRHGVLAGSRVGAVQAPDAVGDGVATEPAQLGRQHGQGDLADAALVVARREFDQRAPVGGRATAGRRRPRRSSRNSPGALVGSGRPTTSARRPRAGRKGLAPTTRRRAGADFGSSATGSGRHAAGASTSTRTVESASAMVGTWCVLKDLHVPFAHSARKSMI